MGYKKLTLLMVSLLALTTIFSGCNLSKKDEKAKPVTKTAKEPPLMLTFAWPGNEAKDTKEVLKEVAKRSKLNIDLNFRFQGYEYITKIEHLVDSSNTVDAFCLGNDTYYGMKEFVLRGKLKDITDLLPKYAPNIYRKLSKEDLEALKIDGKIYAVPNLYPQASCEAVRVKEEFMKKYNIPPIKTLDDYGNYLRIIKENEPDFIPGAMYGSSLELFARAYDYIVLDLNLGLVYKREDPSMKILAWEATPEFELASSYITEWYDKGYILKQVESPSKPLASIFSNSIFGTMEGDSSSVSVVDGALKAEKFYNYPLYPDKPFQKSNLIGNYMGNGAVVFSWKSTHVERTLMFLDWIQSKQENYDVFMYGLKGKHYTLKGDEIVLPQGMDLNNPDYTIRINSPFANYAYTRDVLDVDTKIDKEKYMNLIQTKTQYAPHIGFYPDLTMIGVEAVGRMNLIYEKIINPMMNAQFDINGIDSILADLKDPTKVVIDELQAQLNDWNEKKPVN